MTRTCNIAGEVVLYEQSCAFAWRNSKPGYEVRMRVDWGNISRPTPEAIMDVWQCSAEEAIDILSGQCLLTRPDNPPEFDMSRVYLFPLGGR